MAWGFQDAGVDVRLFPGRKRRDPQSLMATVEDQYMLDKTARPRITFLPGSHKGIYGLLFRSFLVKEWLTNPHGIFFSRDVMETRFLLHLARHKRGRRKIIYEMHDSMFLEHREHHQGNAQTYQKYEKEILSGIDGLIYTNTYLRGMVEQMYSPSVPCMTAVPGFNSQIFSPIPAPTDNRSILVGYFGSLHPGKGVELLLNALKSLPPRYRLRIIGGHPVKELNSLKIKVCEEFDDPTRVEFPGQVPPKDVCRCLRGCHMACIPFVSKVEFLSPIKLYEALGMALPVVSTPVPAVQKAARKLPHVVLASGSTPQHLADAIRDLGENPSILLELHNKAALARNDLAWSARAQRILSFIHSL